MSALPGVRVESHHLRRHEPGQARHPNGAGMPTHNALLQAEQISLTMTKKNLLISMVLTSFHSLTKILGYYKDGLNTAQTVDQKEIVVMTIPGIIRYAVSTI